MRRRSSRLGPLGAALLLLAALAAPPAAQATTEIASAGTVSVTFSYEAVFPPGVFQPTEVNNEHLAITRAGATALEESLCTIGPACPLTAPLGFPEGSLDQGASSSLEVLDLEGDGDPEVLLKLNGGGAHCCEAVLLYWWNAATGGYSRAAREWGQDVGEHAEDLGHNGRLEFVGVDDSFAYAFTSFGGSGMPVQLFAFEKGVFTNVTRSYPARIEADAAKFFKLYKGNYSSPQGGLGYLAAWVADQYLLGRGAAALAFLHRENSRGKLAQKFGVSGSKYISALLALLRRDGYTSGSPAGGGSKGGSGGPVAAPVFGHTANLKPVSGKVRVRLPGSHRFVSLSKLSSVPLGTVVDTTAGTVQLTSAADTSGHTQTGQFYSGIFRLTQTTAPSAVQGGARVGLTVLTLAGGVPTGCTAARALSARAHHQARRLWGNAHGNFRTADHTAAATVRGTKWLIEETCVGTLVRVVRGIVAVENLRTHQTVLVRAGRSTVVR